MDIGKLIVKYNGVNKELLFNDKVIKEGTYGKRGSLVFRLETIEINGWISINCNMKDGHYAFLKLENGYYKSLADENSTFRSIIFNEFKEMEKVNGKWEFVE